MCVCVCVCVYLYLLIYGTFESKKKKKKSIQTVLFNYIQYHIRGKQNVDYSLLENKQKPLLLT